MSQYVDGYVIPLPRDKVDDYRRLAEAAAAIWKEHGALDYRECLADDLDSRGMVSFADLARAQPGETVVFAWVIYASKEERDAVNAKVMADPRLKDLCGPDDQPFDCRRMAYGGFRTLVHR